MIAKEVIFIADDYGLSPEINDAILHAHLEGNLQGAALMMAQPGTDEAIAQARLHPELSVGWHLHLCDSTPATTARWPWGESPVKAGLAMTFSARARELVRKEIAKQWELFQATDLPCRFINSHHHLHTQPFVYRTLLETIGAPFRGWIRLGRPRFFPPASTPLLWTLLNQFFLKVRRRHSNFPATDTLWGMDRTFRMNAAEVQAALRDLPRGFHEFLFHPRSRTCPDTLCLLELKSLLAS